MTVHAPMTSSQALPHGARLVATEGKTLPLASASLRVEAKAGLGRIVLEQRFSNPHAEPLTVTYRMPLPADAAVSAFAFRVGERRIVGEIDRKARARERFEDAILEGKTAALLDEERSSLFTQEIGNIPPGAEVVSEITLDQPLAFLAEGAWELRFPLAAAPRYLGDDAAALGGVTLDVASGALAARASLFLAIGDAVAPGRSPESPSHPLQCAPRDGGFAVELGGGNQAALDRDVVVRWPVARPAPSVELSVARPAAGPQAHPEAEAISGAMFALATLVPPEPSAKAARVTRDMTLLIDTSGSMQGEPLAQAKRVASALVESLSDTDSFDLFEFSSTTSAFRSAPERATKKNRLDALRWIDRLVASGGTEMLTGIRAALADRRPEAQRQIVLITDGLVGFERDVVGALLADLPASARFHALGVGAAANRALLMPVARAGRGVEAILGIGEDPERAARRLLDRMSSPIVVNLSVTGSAVVRSVPERLPDLFAGSPARIALELRPEGGEIVIRGRTAEGDYLHRTYVEPRDPGHGSGAVAKLFARERVEDLEARLAGGGSRASIDREIEGLGLGFAISTRLTSWIAVTAEATVDPRDPSRRETMPQALPFGMSAEGLGLRAASPPVQAMLPPIGAQAYTMAGPMARPAPAPMPKGAPRMAVAPKAALGEASAPPPPPAPSAASAPRGKAVEAGAARARSAPASAGAPPPAQAFGGPPASRSERDDAARSVGGRDDAEKPKEKRRLLAKVVAAVRDAFGGSDEAAAPEALAEIAADGGAAARVVEGRIVVAKDGRVVIELDVDGDALELDYRDASVSLLVDGRPLTARLVVSASTREGRHEAGRTLRVTIEVDAPPSVFGAIEATVTLGASVRLVARRAR